MSRSCPHLDKLLGMREEVTRRDFLDGALLASGAALLAAAAPGQMLAQADVWTGYTGEGDYRTRQATRTPSFTTRTPYAMVLGIKRLLKSQIPVNCMIASSWAEGSPAYPRLCFSSSERAPHAAA